MRVDNRIRSAILAAGMMLGLATRAHAQLVGAGISFLNEDGESAIGVSGDLRQHWFSLGSHAGIGIVVDGGYHKFQGFSVVSGQGGGRLTWQGMRRVLPYVQFTTGFEYCHLCQVTSLVTEPNIGVDLPVYGRKFNIRASFGVRSVWMNGGTFIEDRFWFGISFGK